MPDREQVESDAESIRMNLLTRHINKNWRKLSFDVKKRFLESLFGIHPKKDGYGMFFDESNDGTITITFRGKLEFPADEISIYDDFIEMDADAADLIQDRQKRLKNLLKLTREEERLGKRLNRLNELISQAEALQAEKEKQLEELQKGNKRKVEPNSGISKPTALRKPT